MSSPGCHCDDEGDLVYFTVGDSALGRLLLGRTDRGICALWWGEDDALLPLLEDRFPRAVLVRADAALAPLLDAIEGYLSRNTSLPEAMIDARGTDFQRRVWDALRKIPPGEIRTYAQIAAEIGHPKATRAVARACAANPVALLIPCHRVVRSDGHLAGYRWGLERKEFLLTRGR